MKTAKEYIERMQSDKDFAAQIAEKELGKVAGGTSCTPLLLLLSF